MERACFYLRIFPGTESEYDKRHAEIWPELVDEIRESGLRNFSGFRRGTDVWYFTEGDPDPVPGIVFRAGDRLPVGVEAFHGFEPNDLVLWVESHRVVVSGDTLVDRGNGLELPSDWLREGLTVEEIADGLQLLLELPVEYVLATHGGPTDREALEGALSVGGA